MNGIIYAATNTNRWFAPVNKESKGIDVAFSIYAARSARSVKKVVPNIHITLFADKINQEVIERENMEKVFDDIIFHKYPKIKKGENFQFESKLYAMLNSPYEKTIFLDADTIVLNNRINEFYDALEWHDIAAPLHARGHTICPASFRHLAALGNFEKVAGIDHIPPSFLELSSAALGFNKNSKTRKMLELAYEMYMTDPLKWKPLLRQPPVSKKYWSDMYTLWHAQWEAKVTRFVLPREFLLVGNNLAPLYPNSTQRFYADTIIHHGRNTYEDLTEMGSVSFWKTQFND